MKDKQIKFDTGNFFLCIRAVFIHRIDKIKILLSTLDIKNKVYFRYLNIKKDRIVFNFTSFTKLL